MPRQKKGPITSSSHDSTSSLNVLFQITWRRHFEESTVTEVYADAILQPTGGIQATVTETGYEEDDEDGEGHKAKIIKTENTKKIGSLKAHLIARSARTNNFHEVCDTISGELQECGVTLFDHRGRLRGPITDVVTKKKTNTGNLLYITSVSIDLAHRGSDLGILLMQAVMKALLGRWTLAVIYPAPLRYDPDGGSTFNDIRVKLCRYFSRLGFLQVTDGKFWILECGKFKDSIISKEDAASMEVRLPRERIIPSGLDKEFNDAIQAASSFTQIPSIAKTRELRTTLLEIKDRGGDVNSALCLHYAIANKCIDIIPTLVAELGANVNLQGKTILYLCNPYSVR